MKPVLLAVVALTAFNTYSFAFDTAGADIDFDKLLSADEVAQLADEADAEAEVLGEQGFNLDHPRPRHPRPAPAPRPPHYRPRPRPVPVPYPAPRPAPRRYVCYSTDYRGYSYSGNAYSPYEAQNEARYRCERASRTACYDRGCNLYYGRTGN